MYFVLSPIYLERRLNSFVYINRCQNVVSKINGYYYDEPFNGEKKKKNDGENYLFIHDNMFETKSLSNTSNRRIETDYGDRIHKAYALKRLFSMRIRTNRARLFVLKKK